jgi:LysM repeat protein
MGTSLPAAATGSTAESDSERVEQLAAFRPAAAEPPRFAPHPDEAESDEPDEVPLPTFLNARSSRPRTTATTQEQLKSEDVVPSWSVDRPYRDAEPRGDSDGEGRFSQLLTMAAVVIILALGVATVVIVPGLLAGNPAQTSRPSLIAAPSVLPSPLATSVAVLPSQPPVATSGTPTELIPTPVPTPTPSPRPYKIQQGDTLKRIAREFGVSMDQILAANPQIADADDIRIGERIVIPAPQESPAP